MTSKAVAEFAARTAIGPFGSRMKSDAYTDVGVPVIRGTNLTGGKVLSGDWVYVSEKTADDLSNCCVYPGDLVFPHRGAIGEVGIVPNRFPRYVMSSSLMTLSCDRSKADPEYVYYFFKSTVGHHELLKNASQVGTPGIGQPLSTLRSIEIPLPLLSSQRIVAKVLGDLDSKIDLNRRINQTLEAMAQALFKSWFVDFDPVKAKIAAKAEGRDPQRAAMTAISGKSDPELDALPAEHYEQIATTAALFPDEMEESELGKIPRGWTYGVLGDICSFAAGNAFKPDLQGSKEGDYPFIKVSDMNLAGNEVFIRTANNYVSKAQRSEMRAKLHPPGATVFAKIGVALISNRRRLLITSTIIDNNLMSASPIEGRSGPHFLYSTLSAIDFNTLASGTALPYINVSDLKKILVVRPHSAVTRAYEEKSSAIFSMIQTMAAQSETLAITRDTLLPKLLSGEVEVTGMLEG